MANHKLLNTVNLHRPSRQPILNDTGTELAIGEWVRLNVPDVSVTFGNESHQLKRVVSRAASGNTVVGYVDAIIPVSQTTDNVISEIGTVIVFENVPYDTTGFTEGQNLRLVDGPNNTVILGAGDSLFIATVRVGNVTNGEVVINTAGAVGSGGATALPNLTDVANDTTTSAVDGDNLTFVRATGQWESIAPGTIFGNGTEAFVQIDNITGIDQTTALPIPPSDTYAFMPIQPDVVDGSLAALPTAIENSNSAVFTTVTDNANITIGEAGFYSIMIPEYSVALVLEKGANIANFDLQIGMSIGILRGSEVIAPAYSFDEQLLLGTENTPTVNFEDTNFGTELIFEAQVGDVIGFVFTFHRTSSNNDQFQLNSITNLLTSGIGASIIKKLLIGNEVSVATLNSIDDVDASNVEDGDILERQHTFNVAAQYRLTILNPENSAVPLKFGGRTIDFPLINEETYRLGITTVNSSGTVLNEPSVTTSGNVEIIANDAANIVAGKIATFLGTQTEFSTSQTNNVIDITLTAFGDTAGEPVFPTTIDNNDPLETVQISTTDATAILVTAGSTSGKNWVSIPNRVFPQTDELVATFNKLQDSWSTDAIAAGGSAVTDTSSIVVTNRTSTGNNRVFNITGNNEIELRSNATVTIPIPNTLALSFVSATAGIDIDISLEAVAIRDGNFVSVGETAAVNETSTGTIVISAINQYDTTVTAEFLTGDIIGLRAKLVNRATNVLTPSPPPGGWGTSSVTGTMISTGKSILSIGDLSDGDLNTNITTDIQILSSDSSRIFNNSTLGSPTSSNIVVTRPDNNSVLIDSAVPPVSTASAAGNYVLNSDGSSSDPHSWVSSDLNALDDVTITNLDIGDFLVHRPSGWVNESIADAFIQANSGANDVANTRNGGLSGFYRPSIALVRNPSGNWSNPGLNSAETAKTGEFVITLEAEVYGSTPPPADITISGTTFTPAFTFTQVIVRIRRRDSNDVIIPNGTGGNVLNTVSRVIDVREVGGGVFNQVNAASNVIVSGAFFMNATDRFTFEFVDAGSANPLSIRRVTAIIHELR